MKILAIDSTGLASSVAVVSEDKIFGEFTINNKKTHGETLAPMIKKLIDTLGFELSEINFIACSSGPGSFTGLRIGASIAKGMAHGLNIPIVPVPTLDSLAINILDTNCVVIPIMDARRNQVYSASYISKDLEQERITDYRTIEIKNLLEETKGYNKKIIFLGDGTSVYKNEILNFNKNYIIAPLNNNLQKASSVGYLATKNIFAAVSYDKFVPFYLRLSQAEREYAEKHGEI